MAIAGWHSYWLALMVVTMIFVVAMIFVVTLILVVTIILVRLITSTSFDSF